MADPNTQDIEKANQLLQDFLKTQKESNKELVDSQDIWSAITKDLSNLINSTKKGGSNIANILQKRKDIQEKILQNRRGEARVTEELYKRVNMSAVENALYDQKFIFFNRQLKLQRDLAKASLFKAAAKDLKSISDDVLKSTNFFKLTLGYFRLIDDESARFRIRMGVWRTQSIDIEQSSRKILGELMGIGATIDMVYKSSEAMVMSFGTMYSSTEKTVKALTSWQTNLGVSAEHGAELLRIFSQVSKGTSESQINMAGFLTSLAQSAGVPLNEVMADIAHASKSSYSMMTRSPLALSKAAVEARRLGTTLESIVKSGKQLLEFTDSVNKEMEASVLIGKPINLQRARELSYRRDIYGLNKEILRIAKDEVDFNKLDYFQQEALSAALGRSADEISKMLNSEREINRIRTSGTSLQKDQLRKMEMLEKANRSISEDIGSQVQKQIQQRANQAQINILANQWNQIVYQVVEALFPLTNSILQVLNTTLRLTAPFIKLALVSGVIWKYWGHISLIGSRFLGVVGRFSPMLARVLGPIGLVITGLVAIWNIGKRILNVINDPNMNIGQKILAGVKAVGEGLFETIVSPFKMAFQWLEKTFLGNSPSLIGERMVKGVKAISPSMFGELVTPYKKAKSAISKIFGVDNSYGNIQTAGVTNSVAEDLKSEAQRSRYNQQSQSGNLESLLMNVITSINGLRQDLVDGKVAVYLDSQLVSLHTQRNTQFRRGYGTNNAMAGV